MIIRKNSGGKESLRIVLDPVTLNDNILRKHYCIPTFENLCSNMSGAKILSTLDADCAFWQISIDKEGSDYLVFNTPFGIHNFLRIPYSNCSASEVFKRFFQEIYGDIEGLKMYVHDVLIWGKNEKEHNERLEKVLLRAQERNVRFNFQKCKIGVKEVKYMGHICLEIGIQPDNEKIGAVVNMEASKN